VRDTNGSCGRGRGRLSAAAAATTTISTRCFPLGLNNFRRDISGCRIGHAPPCAPHAPRDAAVGAWGRILAARDVEKLGARGTATHFSQYKQAGNNNMRRRQRAVRFKAPATWLGPEV
jgi:hypothetical protein